MLAIVVEFFPRPWKGIFASRWRLCATIPEDPCNSQANLHPKLLVDCYFDMEAPLNRSEEAKYERQKLDLLLLAITIQIIAPGATRDTRRKASRSHKESHMNTTSTKAIGICREM